ncbi:hypothetical protein [Mycobacterium riyadhense]|uniref:hypothetical protein n=1 Tax=Mycobacterium riyadhense TaxID=486698 RepID=UPI00194F2C55|nr:hypothetical protein [Mycobacterium riyadhense]
MSATKSAPNPAPAEFLDTYGMVVPDPARHGEAAQRAVDQRIAALPDPIAIELRCWIRVLRGEGRHPHPEFPFATIRSYLNCLRPALAAWTEQVTSLREIGGVPVERGRIRFRCGCIAKRCCAAFTISTATSAPARW